MIFGTKRYMIFALRLAIDIFVSTCSSLSSHFCRKRAASKIMQREQGRKTFCSEVHVGIDRINVATSSSLFSGRGFLLRFGKMEHFQVLLQRLSQVRTLTHLRV